MVRAAMLTAVLMLSCAASSPAAPVRLASRVAAIIGSPQYRHGIFGLEVYDLDSGRPVYAMNGDRYFLAASTTKLLTEGTTLSVLGPEYRFRTNVYRTGPVDASGTLQGDLVLRASGDPNLSARLKSNGTLTFENEDHSYDGGADTRAVPGDPLLALHDLAAQIQGFGIKRVAGRVIVDDTMYRGGFSEAGTGAIVSPIMLNDNIVDVTVHAGTTPGDPTTFAVSPASGYVRFVNRSTTANKGTDRHIVLRDDDADPGALQTVTITGTLPAGSPPILYAYDVPSPRRFAEVAFSEELQRTGIIISKAVTESGPDRARISASYCAENIVATHLSAPLSEDVKVTLKVSDNLHADTMPYLWAHGDLNQAFEMERALLVRGGLDPNQVVQNDGLGGDAFIQPAFMVRYLAYVRRQPFFKTFYGALPVLGVDGTLYNIETHSPAAGKVVAKTGTWGAADALNNRHVITAKGLAGYMTTRSGRHIAFAFYVNNLVVPRGKDATLVAGELLGRVATATYLYTP